MATDLTRGNSKINLIQEVQSIDRTDIFQMQSQTGKVKGITKDLVYAEISSLFGGGGAGSGEELDMGSRMTGNTLHDMGSRI
jgi:hypothetical protein